MLIEMPDDVLLGKDHLVIAEIAQAHDGSIATAHRLIDAAARAGASIVKFQTHIAAAESTPREPWRVKFSDVDATRMDYWKRMEFSPKQWHELKSHCVDVGLEFLSSAFSPEAVELLMDVGVRLWKVASGEVLNFQLLDCLRSTGLPVILSSGLSTLDDLDRAVARLALDRDRLSILQCATQYPTTPDRVGLNVLSELQQRFQCVVGISDHSATIYASLAAAALGARVFEVHIREDHDSVGPDSSSSLTEAQLEELVRGISFIRSALISAVDKKVLTDDQIRLREIFGRSLVAARDLAVGHRLTREDIAFKKPGGGLSYEILDSLIGRTLRRSLKIDEELALMDLDGR